MTQIDQLKQFSTIVADTGDFRQLHRFAPQDATTNPSLVLEVVRSPAYGSLVEHVVKDCPRAPVSDVADRVLVALGTEILKVVPGRVSTEIDARLSFDTDATISRAHRILDLYEDAGVDRSRVLIKIAATWEGIQAARRLSGQGVKTNLTLLFCLTQAIACAEAKVQVISPFVGRIYDWHKKSAAGNWDEAAHAGVNDPGVKSVASIYSYYKQHGIRTEVMAASFRNVGQILALAGCDLLTISPRLLEELAVADSPVRRILCAAGDSGAPPPDEPGPLNESAFRFALNQDAMATEKLAEGVRQFVADSMALERLIQALR